MKNNWTLILAIALAFIALIMASSCGTRHVEVIKKDSIHIENMYSQGSKIILGNTFTYKPFDTLKSMVIDGIVYKNVIISSDKSITKEKWKNKTEYITRTITAYRTTIRKDDTFLWISIVLGSILIIGILVLAWFKLPSFKNGNHFSL